MPEFTVQKEGFQKMLKTFDHRYEIPSRSYFSRTAIPALFAVTKEKVANQLTKVEYFASTTDMWSSIGLKPYMSYTIHYINQDWELKSIALATHFLPEDHTGQVISEALEATLEEWGLSPDKQVCLTTDSGSNIIAAANILNWTRLSCFGHNLHLAITKAIQDDTRCTRALAVARKIVSSFSTSWKRRRELTKAQINLDLPQHSLITVSNKIYL